MDNSASLASSNSQEIGNIKRLPIMISLIIGAFFSILNETLLGNAIPLLVTELGVTAPTLQWLSTGYMLVVAVLIPASALLVQWFTTRQVFIGAMTFFTVGTIICGIAPGFSVLLIGRLIQAVGTGLMMPVLMNTILLLYPPEKRGAAMGVIGLVFMFAPAIGPTLSGIILDSLEWRWLFYIVLPFAIFSIIFAFIYLKNLAPPTKPKVDVLSIILSTIGFGGIVYGFSSSFEGWDNPKVYGMIIVGFIALLLFIVRQLKLKEPLLDLRAFKFPMFALTTILLIIMMMTMFSTMSLLPFLFQGALGLSVYASGLIMLPGSLLNGLVSPITGKLFDKFGPRALIIPGTVVLAIVMWFFTQVSADTSKTTFVILYMCLMVSISAIMMPAQTNGLNQLPPRYYPHGTAILNTLSQVAGAIGVAFFISIMSSGQKTFLSQSEDPTSVVQQTEALVSGVHNAFVIGFGFAILAVIVAFFTRRAKTPVE